MKVLVAGGAGYIGSHVVKALLEEGHQVCVFDNFSTGREENLFPQAGLVRGDLMNPGDLERVLSSHEDGKGKGYDAVIHLAAFKAAGESMIKPEKYSLNNINGTINLLNAAVCGGVKYFIFSSTAAVYGEPEYLPIDEKHQVNPENFYGFTKLEIERLLAWYEKLRGIKFAALRYFNAAGYDPSGRIRGLEIGPANLLPVIMEVAAGRRERLEIFGDDYNTPDGTGVRDYVHVTDLAAAHLRALMYVSSAGKSLVLNLGSEKGFSVKEILAAARRITGKEIPAVVSPRRPGDPASLVASSALARDVLGWEARYSDLDSLVATTWEVYRDSMG